MGFLDWFNGKRRHNVRRRLLHWGGAVGFGGLTLSNNKYADVIVASMLDQLCNSLRGTNWSPLSQGSRDFVCFKDFFDTQADAVINALFQDGVAPVVRDEDGFFRLADVDKPFYLFKSTDFIRYGKSSRALLMPFLNYLDDILNAANTSVRRLGVMAFLMPKTDTYGNGLTDEEIDREERRLQADYGVLDSQKIVKMTTQDYTLGVLNIGGAQLQLDARLQAVVKVICGKLGVPYELVPAAIIGNPNQTGVYQKEAVKRLYQLAAAYAEMFVTFAKSFGLSVDYDFPNAPKDYETEGEALSSAILDNLIRAETAGYLTHDEAVERYREKVSAFE